MTERKQAEEDLRRAHDHLEAKVAERTRELTESNARLAEANAQLAEAARRKDDFLAMLAHELRNPLAPVLNGLHIMRLTAADLNAIAQAREMIERQIRHLSRLLDDLLDISRISRGRVQIRRERLDLVGLIRATAEDYRRMIEQAGMRLDFDLSPTPVWAVGDPTRLAQVVNNLLDNAVKFSDGGDLVVIRLTADVDKGEAVIEVQDKGIGIEPELFPRLFNAFEQADRSLDRSRGGLGIGLSVVRGLVRLHGGDVTAASGGPGQGATFSIRLPLQNEPPTLRALPKAPETPLHAPLRVLIVEDNRDAANSLCTLLELLGHEARVAYSGPDGVQLARAWRPDVVLCDIGLPGLDGYGVAAQLRQDPATRHTSLIAITGYGQDEDKLRSHQAGFDHHLVKPVDAAVLQPLLTRPA